MIVSVIGLGKFGARTASRLAEKNIEVIAIDRDENLVNKIKDKVTHAVIADVTDERALRAINISDVDLAIVTIGDNVEVSIMAVAMLRKLGVGRVIARSTSHLHEYVLHEIGASEIVRLEEDMGDIVASKIISPHVLQQVNFAAGYSLVELKVGKIFENKTIVECQFKQKYNLSIVAVQKKKPMISDDGATDFKVELNDNPMPMDKLLEDDIVVLSGREENFDRLYDDLSQD